MKFHENIPCIHLSTISTITQSSFVANSIMYVNTNMIYDRASHGSVTKAHKFYW